MQFQHDFTLRTLQPFLDAVQWIKFRDVSKNIFRKCASLPLDDWLILHQFMAKHIWHHLIFYHCEGGELRVYIPKFDQKLTMTYFKWFKHGHCYFLDKKWLPGKSHVQRVDWLYLQSIPVLINDQVIHGPCLIEIHNITIPVFLHVQRKKNCIAMPCDYDEEDVLIDGAVIGIEISKECLRQR